MLEVSHLLTELHEAEAGDAGAALGRLCELLLGAKPSALLDELSFDIFDGALAHAGLPQASRLLEGVSRSANAREVLCMVLGAFSTHPSPREQLLLLGLLPLALPRLTRKRAELTAGCLRSLHGRFLESWPADDWECMEDHEHDELQAQSRSRALLRLLTACVIPVPALASTGAAADAEARALRLTLVRFLCALLEAAAQHGGGAEDEAAVLAVVEQSSVRLAEARARPPRATDACRH
jgi:hypothetical protein